MKYNLNFLSGDLPTPDIANEEIVNANIGAIFVGSEQDIYTKVQHTKPANISDWVKIYPPANSSQFNVDIDGIYTIPIGDILNFNGADGLYTKFESNALFISGNILSDNVPPTSIPTPTNRTYIYIDLTTNDVYINDNTSWLLLPVNTINIVDNLDGTFTYDGSNTFTGTDDQNTSEVTVSPTISGESLNLNTLLTTINTSFYNISNPIALFEIFTIRGLTITCKSQSRIVDTVSYSWSTNNVGAVITASTSANTDITFTTTGTYNITLTVTDSYGVSSSITQEIAVSKSLYVGGLQASFYKLQDAVSWINSNVTSGDITNWTIYVDGITTDTSPVTLNLAKICIRNYGQISTGLVIDTTGTYIITGSSVFYTGINAGNNIGIDITGTNVVLNISQVKIESAISFTPIINITGSNCTVNATGINIVGAYCLLTNSTTVLNLYESFITATKCAMQLLNSSLNIQNLVVDSIANLHSTDHINNALCNILGCTGTVKGLIVNGVSDGTTTYHAILITPSNGTTTPLYFINSYVKLTGFSTITSGTNIVSALFCKDSSVATQPIFVTGFGCNSSAIALVLVSSILSTITKFTLYNNFLMGTAALLITSDINIITVGVNTIELFENTLQGQVLST